MRLQWRRVTGKNSTSSKRRGPTKMRSSYSYSAFISAVLAAICFAASLAQAAPARTPNVVIIYIDDMGYADIGPFGAKGYSTPHLDKMAAEGMKFTSFYSAQAVCSASRAALMTGCYANRVGIAGA